MKKTFMSLLSTVILVLIVVGIFNGGKMIWNFFTGNSDEPKAIETNEVDQSDKTANDKRYTALSSISDTKFSDFLKFEYTWAERAKIHLNLFNEINDVSKWYDSNMKKMKDNAVYMKRSDDSYKRTLDETDYMYYGELEGDKPTGIGIIFDFTNSSMLSKNNNEKVSFIKYIGYFNDGEFDGYGIEFNVPDPNDLGFVGTNDIINKNLFFINSVYYEGYFDSGEWDKRGNIYLNNFTALARDASYSYKDDIDAKELKYFYIVGEMGDGDINGEAIYYNSDGNKKFEGEVDDGSYRKGTLYFEGTNKIKYKGEFYNGEYEGDGILYDEEGKIVYEGEFLKGDIK